MCENLTCLLVASCGYYLLCYECIDNIQNYEGQCNCCCCICGRHKKTDDYNVFNCCSKLSSNKHTFVENVESNVMERDPVLSNTNEYNLVENNAMENDVTETDTLLSNNNDYNLVESNVIKRV